MHWCSSCIITYLFILKLGVESAVFVVKLNYIHKFLIAELYTIRVYFVYNKKKIYWGYSIVNNDVHGIQDESYKNLVAVPDMPEYLTEKDMYAESNQ
jgi:hypothetical protein